MAQQELYSYHVFLFSFQWYYTGKNYKHKTFEEKTALKDFMELMQNTPWKRSKLSPDNILYYNEYNYFYDFVRDILYDKPVGDGAAVKEPEFIAHYEYDIEPDELFYTISIQDKDYKLHIDSILLHLYNTGIGVLSFHLNNRFKNQSHKEDILKINQYGRRLYPPFFKMHPQKIGQQEQFNNGGFDYGLKGVKESELASSITIGNTISENWIDYTNPQHFSKNPFNIPAFIKTLFPSIPFTTNPSEFQTDDFSIFISPALDDRMFVVCWYGNDEVADEMRDNKNYKAKMTNGKFNYIENEWLYKYLFIDVSLSCQNKNMLEEKLTEHVNARWVNYATLFGATRYSFISITQELSTMRDFSGYIVNHVQTMYYKMVELCLVQRACLLRFADEVTNISGMMKKEDKYLSHRVSNLYKQYIRFVNKIYFREITDQEQGIELYDLLQKHMRIDRDVKDLDNEIEELHNYVMMEEEHKRNKSLQLLTILGSAFIAPTFLVSLFSVSVSTGQNIIQLLAASVLISFLSILIVRAQKNWYRIILAVFTLLTFLALILYFIKFYTPAK